MLPKLSGEKQVLGLLGHKIDYSLSPSINNFSAKKLGINAAYLPFDIDAKHLERFLAVAWHLGFVGLNVTKPYKEKVTQILKVKDLQSVNTLFRNRTPEGRKFWAAASTDALGFENGLKALGVNLESFSHIVFMGSGGAMKAILKHLANFRSERSVHVLRRNARDDKSLKNSFSTPHFTMQFEDFSPVALKKITSGEGRECLLIQATPLPLQGNPLTAFAKALASKFSGVVVDLTYNCNSDLLRVAQQRGLRHQDGIPMLIEQARLSQELWWGKSVPSKQLLQHLKTVF